MQHPVRLQHAAGAGHLQQSSSRATMAAEHRETRPLSEELFGEILFKCPVNGMDTLQYYDEKVLKPIAERVGSPYLWDSVVAPKLCIEAIENIRKRTATRAQPSSSCSPTPPGSNPDDSAVLEGGRQMIGTAGQHRGQRSQRS